MLKFFAFILLLAYSFSGNSQDLSENGFYGEIFEGLEYPIAAQEAKYDLNNLDLNTLLTCSFLNHLEAARLLEHKNRFGEWRCVEELQSCTFLRIGQIDSLRCMVFVANNYFPSSKLANKFQAYLACRYLQKDTFATQQFPDLLAIRTQFKFQFDDLKSFNFSAERDAGEAWIYKNSPHPVDYCAFTFSGLNKSSSIRYFVGDYEVLFGYGLGLYQGYLLSSRNAWNGIQASAQLFKAHTSMRENGYCEGLAIEWNRKNLTVGAFMSYRKLDNSAPKAIIGLSQVSQSSGLHVTTASREARQSIPFYQCGIESKWTHKNGAIAAYLLAHILPTHPLSIDERLYGFSWSTPFLQAGLSAHYTIRNTYLQAEALLDNQKNFKYQIKLIHPFYGGDLYCGLDDNRLQSFNWGTVPGTLNEGARSWNINWQSPLFLRASKVNIGFFQMRNGYFKKDQLAEQGVLQFRCEHALTKKQVLIFTWQERWDNGVWESSGEHFSKRMDNHKRVFAIGAKSEEVGLGSFSWLVQMSIGKDNRMNGLLSSCKQKFRLRYLPGNWIIDCQFYQIKDYANRMYLVQSDWPGTMMQTAYSGDGIRAQINWKFPIHKNIDLSCFLGNKWQFSPVFSRSFFGLLALQMRV